MKIEIRYTLVDYENLLLPNLYILTSINKRLKRLRINSCNNFQYPL